jgi:(p)ppGpp synthase/HD superfamily hydrolase
MQLRRSLSSSYINHLIEVAELVAGSLSESDTNLIIAALLHDVIEDTPTTKQDLIVLFGTDVAGLVAEATDDKSLRKTERNRVQLETAPMKSKRAQAIRIQLWRPIWSQAYVFIGFTRIVHFAGSIR